MRLLSSPISQHLVRGLRKVGVLLLDAVLPRRCIACGGMIGDGDGLCAQCWGKARFLADPLCHRCGVPLPGLRADAVNPDGSPPICGACFAAPPRYDRARAVLAYDDFSRPLVLRLKHADRTETAPIFARWMARAGAALLADADLILPVPLHRRRLFRRTYNQAGLLARHLARLSARPWQPDLLRRIRSTPAQGRMNRRARFRNIARAFDLRPGGRALVAGKAVLLVDDVLTTGATVQECARLLRRAGARRVDVLTLARVVLDDAE